MRNIIKYEAIYNFRKWHTHFWGFFTLKFSKKIINLKTSTKWGRGVSEQSKLIVTVESTQVK